jgi:hypothetical protein
MSRKEKSDQEYEDEWTQVAIAKDKVREALKLLSEVRSMKQADGYLVIHLHIVDDSVEELKRQVELFDNPNYSKCFGCGWYSMHTQYQIRGSRSHCCNA